MNTNIFTPLRYPGGKTILTDYLSKIISCNSLNKAIYVEPFCGGSGAAIRLLINNQTERIILNDADKSIFAFWYSLKHFGDSFINLIEKTNVSIDEWIIQKSIFTAKNCNSDEDLLKLGFSTFFLNRCNRSGILNAGPIGGNSKEKQENASFKINARFNKPPLIEKVKAIIRVSDRIDIYNLDALKFLKNVINTKPNSEKENIIIYLDPPYYSKGSSLYLNYYHNHDHELLRNFLFDHQNSYRWLLSYDNVNAIKELYRDFDLFSFYLNYSAHNCKLGSELLIHSCNTNLPIDKTVSIINQKKVELLQISKIAI